METAVGLLDGDLPIAQPVKLAPRVDKKTDPGRTEEVERLYELTYQGCRQRIARRRLWRLSPKGSG